MKDLSTWDDVWVRVKLNLEDMAGAVTKTLPIVACQISRTKSDAFPFNATASFSRTGAPADEDAVVTVSGHACGETLHMSADVARGGGFVLLDGPIVEVTVRSTNEDLGRDLEPWLADIQTFLQEAVGCLVRELQ